MAKTLSHEDARRVYDRIGSLQDSQAFYEDQTTDELLRHGAFDKASSVFEFGCGTGRLAERLLDRLLPPEASYRGIDLSPTMIGLARRRLARFGARAEVSLSEGGAPVDEPTGGYDRWLSTFVFDLLSVAQIEEVLAQAHRMLRPGGLLCLAGLGTGDSLPTRALAGIWSTVHGIAPELVGGCRPLDLRPLLTPDRWRIMHHRSLAPYFVPSDAVVAARIESGS